MMMSKILTDDYPQLFWDQSKCSACMSCVVVCSERHTGTSAPSRAHIQITMGLFDGGLSADYCRQCADAPCAAVCPTEAISLDGQLHYWRVDDTVCAGCGDCVDACPYHAIRLDVVTGVAAKCDLCLGATWCVAVCPTQALIFD